MKKITSKFSILPIFICLFISFAGVAPVILSYNSPHAGLLLPLFGLLFVVFFWLTEFRTKAHWVNIRNETISVREFFGLRESISYELSEIKGFVTTKQTGGAGKYEYIFIINDKKRLVCVSEFYHRNYEQLKKEIEIILPYIGEKKYNFKEEYSEMFK